MQLYEKIMQDDVKLNALMMMFCDPTDKNKYK